MHLGHIILRQAGENSLLSGCWQKWKISSLDSCALHYITLHSVHFVPEISNLYTEQKAVSSELYTKSSFHCAL